MLEQLKSKLKASVNFPSPPTIAQQIIALARDPQVDISQVAAVISLDAGLADKLLCAANSALYSRHRKSTNLRQALVALGLRGAITLALGFCLVATYRGMKSNGVDYERHWRRAILSSSVAKRFGALQSFSTVDDIFLAALLQDIAILGVDRAEPNFYRALPRNAKHEDFAALETGRLGVDHAELGAWLLEYWKLPAPLCRAVAWSHEPPCAERSTPAGMAACCVALGSECAEILLTAGTAENFAAIAEHAQDWLGIDVTAVAEVVRAIVAELPEIERLFATKLPAADVPGEIVAQARELLTLRKRQAPFKPPEPAVTALNLATHAAESHETQRCDGLTGLYNRGYLDMTLRREFQAAIKARWPLSVVCVDLSRGKGVKGAYGREAGDAVLVKIGQTIASVARDSDCVARYGNEEFVIVLPGLESPGTDVFCERLIARLSSTRHPIGGSMVTVKAFVGLATHTPAKPLQGASDMIDVAHRSSYGANKPGSVDALRMRRSRPASV
jgi:diguanylate cyclase (GGDEF)-like protein